MIRARPSGSPSILALAAATLLLSGCTTFQDYWTLKRGGSLESRAPIAERPVEDPILPNHFVLETPTQSVIGVPQVVFTTGDDTLSDLARTYGLGYDELIEANPDVDPWLPGEQTPVLLPTQYVLPAVPREGIVLNIASKRLFYYPAVPEGQSQIVKTFPIGIGRVGWETPLGDTSVVAKAVDPHWYVPISVRKEHAELGNPLPSVIPPGPDNPLGSRVLKLDMPGYLIHGTNQPYGVGMRVSHGCVRLYPENIEFLYELVEIGETVRIINEPYLLGRNHGELYFESHTPLEDDPLAADERLEGVIAAYEDNVGMPLSRKQRQRLHTIASTSTGVPSRVEKADRDEVLARARHVRNTVVPSEDAPTLSEVRDLIDEAMQESETL